MSELAARLRLSRATAALEADPLGHSLHSSEPAREFVHAVARQLETLLRSGNKAGKTTAMSRFVTGMAQARPEIDDRTILEARAGVPYRAFKLPEIRTPNTWWVLVHGLKLAVDSVVECMRAQLGDYPSREIPSQAGGLIAGWYIKPWNTDSNDYKKRWSRVMLFPEKGEDPVAGRVDGIWADEPPRHSFWQEMRMRGRALNAPFYSAITFTPKDRPRWEPYRNDFRNCRNRARGGRYEVVMSVFDNQALTPEDIQKIREKVADDPLELARLYGQYVDVDGANPFKRWAAVLTRWRKHNAVEPLPMNARVRALIYDALTGKRDLGWEEHAWQMFDDYDPTEEYWMVLDPSMGIEDPEGEHSPAGGGVLARGQAYWSDDGTTLIERMPYVAARFNDYVTSYTLGSIGSDIWHRYNGPPHDIDNTGGYGEMCIYRMLELGCDRTARYAVQTKPGNIVDDIGWKANEQINQQILGSIQRVLEESRHQDTFDPRSAELIETLMSARVDRNGRLIQGAGRHTEDITWLGRALWRHFSQPLVPPPQPRRQTFEDILRRETGRSNRRVTHQKIRWG